MRAGIDLDISVMDGMLRQLPITRSFVEACNARLPKNHERVTALELSPWWHARHTPDTAVVSVYAMRRLGEEFVR
jgi:hypothetical protein